MKENVSKDLYFVITIHDFPERSEVTGKIMKGIGPEGVIDAIKPLVQISTLPAKTKDFQARNNRLYMEFFEIDD